MHVPDPRRCSRAFLEHLTESSQQPNELGTVTAVEETKTLSGGSEWLKVTKLVRRGVGTGHSHTASELIMFFPENWASGCHSLF